ncbi:MAG: non-canonical purine NTP pyrophosphatase, RdgB/HAM1 family [Spirochaetes bacterium]|nr:MAG: non-canonical purine NTP pyrophosphatase, RdgB/HAM1 family [Spirochaetota bacterium]
MEIILASGNRHKLFELKEILTDHTLLLPEDIGISFDFEETGTSFLENSQGKAFALFNKISRPVLADDSGLIVEALNGEPGIYSARYGSVNGIELEAPARNIYLLDKLQGESNLSAEFICCMSLILDKNRFFVAQESFKGEITRESTGINGFGYDPIFFLPEYGKTVAELPEKEKNKISHRGKAGYRIAKLLEEL